jgi:hypothetical protein
MEKPASIAIIPEGTALVVSHDAGGAEILSSLLKLKDIPYLSCLAGPAVKIFQRKLGTIDNYSLEEGIGLVDWVLTGTSWASDLEYQAIRHSKNNQTYVISYLDHWVNYRERFSWHGPSIFPDEIWVGDSDALELAKSLFINIPIKLLPNPYWQEVSSTVLEKSKLSNSKNSKILFSSTNIDGVRAMQSDIKFSDNDIFEKFLSKINEDLFGENISYITIGLHPSENSKKYSIENIKKNKYKIIIDDSKDVIPKLIAHSHIVGCESMLLVLAKICNKKTINIDMNLPRLRTIPSKYIDFWLS